VQNSNRISIKYPRILRVILLVSAITIFVANTNLLPQINESADLKTIYIIPLLGHLDLGFTATQREVRRKWPRIYRDGISFLERHPEATLTSDSLLPLEWFREDASLDEWRRFRGLVKSGRWELTAGWAHMNTAMMSEAEVRRFFLPSRRWEEELGVPIRIWHHADVPGLSLNTAEAAINAKLDMIVVGANELGGLSKLPKDLSRLFNWEAPDGQKIIVSLHGGSGYLEGPLDLRIHVRDGLEERLKKFKYNLKKSGYLPDFTMVLFSSGDNRGPEIFEQLLKTVNQWNSEGKTPKLQISTLSNFKEIIKGVANTFPLSKFPRKCDWPASWEALVRRAPRGESLAKEAQRNLVAAEALSVVNSRPDRPAFDLAWRNLLSHDEHSGVGVWPRMLTHEQALEQNRTEYEYALMADEISKKLVTENMKILASRVKDTGNGDFIFFNATSRQKYIAINYPEMKYIKATPINNVGYTISKIASPKKTIFIAKGKKFWEIKSCPWPLFDRAHYLSPLRSAPSIGHSASVAPINDGMMITRLLFNLPFGQITRKLSLFAVHETKNQFHISGILRGGIWGWMCGDGSLSYPLEGVWLQDFRDNSLLITSIDGTPFDMSSHQLLSLIYIKEPPSMFQDGTIADVDPEPGAPPEVLSRYIVNEKGKINELDAMAYLSGAANPLAAMRIDEGEHTEDLPHDGGAYLDTDDLRAWITEIKWADFGEGVIIAVRNVSDSRITVRLRSDFWRFLTAAQVDGLQRDVTNENLYCTDERNGRADCHGPKQVNPNLVLGPKQVIELRLALAPKKTGK